MFCSVVSRSFRLVALLAAGAILLMSAPRSVSAQAASPGPVELLPYDEAFIAEAFKDLLQSTSGQIADWTGWQGTAWVSPHAYDGHIGTDYSLETGTPLYAPGAGTVVERANTFAEGDHTTYYGNFVHLQLDGVGPEGQLLDLVLGHMLPNVQVTVGQHVTAGQLVGFSDNTGNSTSEHVHTELRYRSTGAEMCPFYQGLWKYPIMFNSTVNRQVGHVVKVSAASTAIRTDMLDTASVITTAYQNQTFFACYWQRGYYRVFIPNNTTYRAGWIKALDCAEIYSGVTVVQALPDAVAYVHTGTLAAPYVIRATPDAAGAQVGQIVYGGGRFAADQVQNGWYRIPVPGATNTWGWVLPNNRMIVYPNLYNPALNPANMPSNSFPFSQPYNTLGVSHFGTSKFNRSEVKSFSPSSPGGDGKALFMTDATNTGNGMMESVIYGKVDSKNYYVEADCYFAYHNLSTGYEVYGIFARDDGFAGLDQTFEGSGNSYALVYNNNDGRVWAGKVVNASLTDFQSKRKNVTTNGWHKLRIECFNSTIRFYMDGVLLVQSTDTTFPSGPCGTSYSFHKGKTWITTRGCYFDNFSGGPLSQ